MFAIRSLRSAAGAVVEGVSYGHFAWTLASSLSADVQAASTPAIGQAWPVLKVIEVSGPTDPALGDLPVSNAAKRAADEAAAAEAAAKLAEAEQVQAQPSAEQPGTQRVQQEAQAGS